MKKKSKRVTQFFVFLVFALLINALFSLSFFAGAESSGGSGYGNKPIYTQLDFQTQQPIKLTEQAGANTRISTNSDLDQFAQQRDDFVKKGTGNDNQKHHTYDQKNVKVSSQENLGQLTKLSDDGTKLEIKGSNQFKIDSKGNIIDKVNADGSFKYKDTTIKSPNGQSNVELTSDGFKVEKTEFNLKGQDTQIEINPNGKEFKIDDVKYKTDGQEVKVEVNSEGGVKVDDKSTMHFSNTDDTVHITSNEGAEGKDFLKFNTNEGELNVENGLAKDICPCSACTNGCPGFGDAETTEKAAAAMPQQPGSGLGGLGQQGLGQGGTFEQQLMGALQAVMGLIGQLKGIVDSIAQSQQAAEDQKGQLQQQTELPQLQESGTGQGTPTATYENAGDGIKVTQASSDVYLRTDNGNELVVNARPDQTAISILNTGLDSISSQSSDVIVAPAVDGATPVALVRSGEEGVNINSQGIAGGEPSVYSESSKSVSNVAEILPLINADDSITGETISSGGQSVKFVQHDIEIGGKKILVFPFKAYNQVSGKGSGLVYLDGYVNVEFEGPKTYYPREIKQSYHFVNKISNEYDSNNYFRLTPNAENSNDYLVDGKKITTVGDDVSVNPLEGYDNIPISKTRQAMWKKATQRV